jgi:hypothetical protein
LVSHLAGGVAGSLWISETAFANNTSREKARDRPFRFFNELANPGLVLHEQPSIQPNGISISIGISHLNSCSYRGATGAQLEPKNGVFFQTKLTLTNYLQAALFDRSSKAPSLKDRRTLSEPQRKKLAAARVSPTGRPPVLGQFGMLVSGDRLWV